MSGRTELEQAIVAWGRHDPLDAGDAAMLARIVDRAEADAAAAGRRRPGAPVWLAGAAVAASVAVALLLAPRPEVQPAGPVETVQVIEASAATSEGAAFALLYTPTMEEEYQL